MTKSKTQKALDLVDGGETVIEAAKSHTAAIMNSRSIYNVWANKFISLFEHIY